MPNSKIPADYEQRVYAGVLGKLIGVYLGRPFEGWQYSKIMSELGEIQYYVHEKLNKPLVVTDDDISGTFTFFRALEDFGYARDLTAAQIGQTWLNYIIENRTILWWGGMGVSTEHTAFARLKRGIPAPRSGSIELNGKVVAEQIGAQIFIDGWGLAAPGNPELAADLAKKAGSVSHDGEAVYGGQVVAAMVAQAFVESDLSKLFDTAVRFVPKDCTIRKLIDDIRNWRVKDNDWRQTRERIQAAYGYDKFGGGCHMIPNHAVIVLALLYGEDNFQKSLMIANTAGWDTDCNSGNVGAIMGVKLGLAGIDAGPDWRGPVADKLFLPTADGGRCISDAVTETLAICRAGRKLAGAESLTYKNGAKFHFELPGSVQGFTVEDSVESRDTACVENVAGHSRSGSRSLKIAYRGVTRGRSARAGTPTFTPKTALEMPGYSLHASPTLYTGQVLSAAIEADAGNAAAVTVRPYVRCYGADDQLVIVRGAGAVLAAGGSRVFDWKIPETDGPIADAGIEVASDARADGVVYLDYLTWSGAPTVTLGRPKHNGSVWGRAWVNAADFHKSPEPNLSHRVAGEEGHALIIQGTREWRDYCVSADVRPHLASAAGIAACVQGLQRYYALVVCPGNKIRLLKQHYGVSQLAEADFTWNYGDTISLSLATNGAQLMASANGKQLFKVVDRDKPLESGAVALLVEAGRIDAGAVVVTPAV
jgi:ADP-ribosylglycohydrolase